MRKTTNEQINQIYESSMTELDEFYGLNWKRNRPKLILVPDRKTIDSLWGKKTEDWSVGWVWNQRDVYLLSPENYEAESCHKFTPEEYSALLKHELAHCFTSVISGDQGVPSWLNEGISIYLSGQNKFKNRPESLNNFLDFYKYSGKKIYHESGFAVESLVENHGKEKLLNVLRRTREEPTEEKFKKLFEEVYGFDLKYENFPL